MVSEHYKNVLIIIDRLFNIDVEKINNDSVFKDIGISSLDKIMLYNEIEYTYHIKIEDDDLWEHEKIGDLVKYLEMQFS